MDVLFQICLVLHLLSLLVAGGAVVAIPVMGRQLAGVGPEVRNSFGGIAQILGRNSQRAFGVLVVTGVLMVWLRYGGIEGLSPWFWVKMVLVVVIAVGMQVSARSRGRGNGQLANISAWVARLALVGVIMSAVLAFS